MLMMKAIYKTTIAGIHTAPNRKRVSPESKSVSLSEQTYTSSLSTLISLNRTQSQISSDSKSSIKLMSKMISPN
ncbi:hypothetical protein HanIR_Chr01g0027411 [Helianthus annuus]|nr:hypothetical protein HanIR_Chr01g0027411 [Helianthus annuus]